MNLEETKVRLNSDHKRRIVALVGENQMAAFIREAVEEALQRREVRAPAPVSTRNRPPGAD